MYVVHLQKKVQDLEEEVRRREAELTEVESPNSEELVRGIGAVKFGDYEHYKEPRYVGSSSGITVTRLVLESAKKDLEPEEFKDLTFKHNSPAEKSPPSSNDHPPLSDLGLDPAPDPKLPPRVFGEKLISYFCQKCKLGLGHVVWIRADS